MHNCMPHFFFSLITSLIAMENIFLLHPVCSHSGTKEQPKEAHTRPVNI